MNCPACGFGCSSIVDSRPIDGRYKRRRECEQCGFRYNTTEIWIEDYNALVAETENLKNKIKRIAKRLERLSC